MAKQIVKEDIEKIKSLVLKVLENDDELTIERMGGLTNHTYKVGLNDGSFYVIRIPGDGTEEMIDRKDEKVSTLLACSLGIDEQVLYFGDDGSKVTKFIDNAITMNKDLMKEEKYIEQVAEIFKKLHNCGVDTKVPFEVFDMAADYEKIIFENNVSMYDDYDDIKNQIMSIKNEIDSNFIIKKVPCHNDPLCENWVLGSKQMYLIDWEYAGMNDGLWDLADVSIEAEFTDKEDRMFLNKYYGRDVNEDDMKAFYANKIYVDFLWTLWAKTRVPFDGQAMEDWASERYERLKANINKYKEV